MTADQMPTVTVFSKSSPIAWGVLSFATYLTTEVNASTDLKIDIDTSEKPSHSCSLNDVHEPLAVLKSLVNASEGQGSAGSTHDESERVAAMLLLAQNKLVTTTDFAVLSSLADELDDHLTLRSFAVGYHLTAADFALWGALRGSTPLLGILKKNLHPHLSRYYAFMEQQPSVKSAMLNLQNTTKQKMKTRTTNATFELGLPNAKEGAVCTRLPPEPSGYLHIGHAKAAILNQYFAQHYKGRFLVRFDDTNPSKEKAEFQDSILEDLELMGIKADALSYTSDYFDKLFQLAIQMIKTGKAYTDDTVQEKMRQERMDGIASVHRDDSVEDNLAHFSEMQSGSTEGVRWCLRAKISVDDPNKALRDPVIYRCNLQPHHRTGTTWKLYPGYDFACPIVDSIEGVTHALRTNEYRDRNPQYWWMLEALGLRKVDIWDFGRISFVYTMLSKRKLKAMVEEKQLVSGWDDPRFPTVRGMRRRGLTIEGLKQYMLSQGPSQAVTSLEWDGIWTTNKKIIDPISPRHTAVDKQNMVKVSIKGGPEQPYSQAVPKHKKALDLGNKSTTYASTIMIEQEDAVSFGDDEEVTFMDWGNAIIRKKTLGSSGQVESIEAELHLEGDFKKTSKKVHWLASSDSAPLVEVTLIDYDYLITKKKIEESDDWTDFINPVTEFSSSALADANVNELKAGDIIQFERKGYYVVDSPSSSGSMTCILIPDGKGSSVALKAQVDAHSRPTSNAALIASEGPQINMYKVDPVTTQITTDFSAIKMHHVPSIYG